MLNLFAASINISPLSDTEAIFGQGGGRKYEIIKFRFVPKLPSICINQKCSMGVGSLHILYSLNLNGIWGRAPSGWRIRGYLGYQNNLFLGTFS